MIACTYQVKLKCVWLFIGCLLILGTGQTAQADTDVYHYNLPPILSLPLAQSVLINIHKCQLAPHEINLTGAAEEVTVPDNKDGPYKGVDSEYREILYCPVGKVQELINDKIIRPQDVIAPPAEELSTAETAIIWAINGLLMIMANIGNWLVQLSAWILSPLLGLRSFITHPLVTAGWPLLLGIANLGFMIALLFIAFATTLRIESMGASRMLPKLFIAAILINFSLIIAGLFLDASRIVMAIMVQSMTQEKLSGVGAAILQQSGLVQAAYQAGGGGTLSLRVDASAWANAFTVLQATILIWVVAAGIVILTVSLLIRYIALILLLIVSPLAYVALAFPNTSGFTKKWWSMFIKYVLFGPAALFVLILLIKLTGSTNNIFNQSANNNPSLDNVLTIIMTSVMCIAAVVAGKSFGTYGANATMGFVGKGGKKLLRYTPPAIAGRAAGRTGLFVAQRAKAQVGDFGGRVKKDLLASARSGTMFGNKGAASKTAAWLAGASRDDKGNLKKGQTSAGLAAGKWASSKLGLADPRKEADKGNIKKNLAPDLQYNEKMGKAASDTASFNKASQYLLMPTNLSEEHVLSTLDKESPTSVEYLLKTGSASQVNAVVKNVDYIREIKNKNPERLNKLQIAISQNIKDPATNPMGLTDEQRARALNTLVDKIKELGKE